MKKGLALRTILVLLVLAGAVYVALAAALIAGRVLPEAGDLEAYSRNVLREHEAIRAGVDSLDTAMAALRRFLEDSAPGDSLPVAVSDEVGDRVRRQLDRVAGIGASARLQEIPAGMRLELAAAAGDEQAAAATVLEAIAALELDRRDHARDLMIEADSLRSATRRHLDTAQRLAIDDVVARERSLVAAADATYETLGYWALVGGLLIAMGALLVHRRLYRPLADLEKSLQRVAGGDLSAHVDVRSDDELGRLGAHFNRMTAVLRERTVDERRRREDLTASFGEILEDSEGEILLFEERSLAIVRSTRGARRALGYTGEELRRCTPLDLWTTHDRASLEDALAPLRSGEAAALRFSTRQARKDGSTYPVEVALHLSSVAQPPVFVAFVQDLTGRELNDRLREFVLEQGRVIGGGDLTRALEEICVAVTRILDVDRGSVWRYDDERIVCLELYDRHADRHVRDHDLMRVDQPDYFDALAEGRPIAAHAAREDVRTRQLLDTYLERSGIVSMLDVPVRVGGRLAAVICAENVRESRRWTSDEIASAASLADLVAIAIEAAERLRTQEALLTSEARYRAAFEQAGVGIAETDLDGRILRANEAFGRMLQRDEDLTGRSTHELTHAEDRELQRDALRRLASGQETVVHRELRWVARGGQTVWTSVTSAPVLTADGRSDHIISVVEDITERRSLQTQLTHVQKMESIGRLAGGMAHDFNNLLTAILGYVDLARDAAPESAPLAADLEEIERAARRGAQMTRQLLTFARRQVVDPTPVNVNELVRGVGRLVRPLLGERIELTLDLDPALHPVIADAGQLENVLINLIVNARDAIPRSGEVLVRTRNVDLDGEWTDLHPGMSPGEHVSLTVADTGTGMDAVTLSRIFEPFFTTKEAGKGTGLGLATCYGIVRQAGGDIEAKSEVGRGTTMRVYLPVAALSAPGALATPRTVPSTHGGGRTALLVDDEPQIRSLMVRTFERLGFEVLEAGSAEEAVEVAGLHGGPLDLLVTDMVLPGKGGRELAEELATLQPGLPVLYVSGYTQTQLEHEALIAEGSAFLPKPFTVTELAERVGELLG